MFVLPKMHIDGIVSIRSAHGHVEVVFQTGEASYTVVYEWLAFRRAVATYIAFIADFDASNRVLQFGPPV